MNGFRSNWRTRLKAAPWRMIVGFASVVGLITLFVIHSPYYRASTTGVKTSGLASAPPSEKFAMPTAAVASPQAALPSPDSPDTIPAVYLPNQLTKVSNGKENSITAMLTPNFGWKLALTPEGMFTEPMELLRTDNGKKTWTTVASSSDKENSILIGDKTGVSLLTRQKGWITATTPREDDISFFVSKDGGSTWKKQNVNIPGEFDQSMFSPYPPAFFSTSVGIMLPNPSSPPLEDLLYVTSDGGESWSPIVNQVKGSHASLHWDFSDSSHYNVTLNAEKWVSTDRGFTWDPQHTGPAASDAQLSSQPDPSASPDPTYSIKAGANKPELISRIYDVKGTIESVDQTADQLIAIKLEIIKEMPSASGSDIPEFKAGDTVTVRFDEKLSDKGQINPKKGDEVILTVGKFSSENNQTKVWGSNFQWYYFKKADGKFYNDKGDLYPLSK